MNRNMCWMTARAGWVRWLVIAAACTAGSSSLSAQTNLLENGNFLTGLSSWKTEGNVTGGVGKVTLSENGTAPVLYQAVSVAGYAYELRFDIFVGDMSSSAGTGDVDRGRLSILGGTDASTLNLDTAAEEIVLIEISSTGLVALAANVSGGPNVALGPDWYSVVAEFVSDYPAIAPIATIIDRNGASDSSLMGSNVRLIAVDRGRLANISNRGAVGTGPNRMIASFVLSGPVSKSVVVRGAGPWLFDLGVAAALEDPAMELKNASTNTLINSNDDWEVGNDKTALIDAMTKVGAWGIPFKAGSKDAGLFQNAGGGLAAGNYSVIVEGRGANPLGIGIAEIYDYDVFADGTSELVNISNRGVTATGAGAQIPGFVLTGERGRVVLIRVVGPSLATFVNGTLDDPLLILTQNVGGTNVEVIRNDDYYLAENADQIVATGARVGAFALDANEKDSAILIGLEPGIYTAQAAVKNATDSGIVLVEVYLVTDNTRPTAATHVIFVSTAGSTILPMDEILDPDLDGEGDILSIASYSQPAQGSVDLNDDGELVFTNEVGFIGQTLFSYNLTDGEFESAPGVIGLNVATPGAQIWTGGGTSGNFSDPANWAGGEVPGPTDDVWIVPQGDAVVTLDQDTELRSLRIGGIGSKVTFKNTSRTLTTSAGIAVGFGSTFELSGAINGGDNFVVNGKLKWTGGTMTGSGTTVIEKGGTADISGTLLLTGNRALLNKGTVTQTGASYLRTNGGSNSTITNAAGANWNSNIQTGTYIAYSEDSSSTLNFVNAGKLTKSGASTSYLGYSAGTTIVTNTGTIEVGDGILQYEGNGTSTHGGTAIIADGAGYVFNRGTHTFPTGAEITGNGEFQVAAADVTLTGSYTLPKVRVTAGSLNYNGSLSIETLAHAGGTISGSGSVTITGSADWSGTTVQAGSGTTLIAKDAVATMAGSHYLDGNRDLINNGTFTQTGGTYLRSRSGGASTVTNAAGANWNANLLEGYYIAYAEDGSSNLDFVNAGTLTKSGIGRNYIGYSAGTTQFTNSGTVAVTEGVLQYEGNGASTHGGTVTIADSASYVFNRGTHTFPAGAEITGEGVFYVGAADVVLTDSVTLPKVTVTGGSLTYNGTLSVGTLTHSAGTISGAGDLTITGSVDWTGTTSQAGAGTTIIAADATATMTGTHALDSNRNFTNNGTFTQTGGLYFKTRGGSNSTMTNAAGANWNVNIAANYTFAYSEDGSSVLNFVNEGTVTKSGTALAYIGYSAGETRVTNTGTITVTAGNLQFEGNGASTHGGTLSLSDGALAIFNRGTHVFPSGADIADNGTFYVTGVAAVTLTDNEIIPDLTVAAGSLTYNGTLSVGRLVQSGGTISGAGDLTVTGSVDWTGTTSQAGAGTTIIAVDATATMTGTHSLDSGRNFANNGTFTQSGGTYFRTRGGSNSTMTNAAGANWNVNIAANYIFAYSEDGSSVLNFVNEGTLTKSGTALAYIGYSAGETRVTNTGSIIVSAGNLQYEGIGASTHGGTLSLGDGALAIFNRGTHVFPSGANIAGDGTFYVTGVAAVTVTDSETMPNLTVATGSLTYNGTLSVGALVHSGGRISGGGDLTVTGSAEWSGTADQAGAGTTVIASDATATMTGTHALDSGRNFTNNGTFTQTGGTLFRTRGGSNSTMTNAAGANWNVNIAPSYTFAYSEDGSSVLNFVNEGTVTKSGSGLAYIGSSAGDTKITNTGSIIVSAGNLQFEGNGASTHEGTLSLGDGAFAVFNRGTHMFPNGANIAGIGTFYVTGVAAVTVTDNEIIPNLTMAAGSLTYKGTLSVGALVHSGGTISGAGDLTVTGTAEWTGTTSQAGAGTTVIAADATATMTGTHALDSNRNFTNNGTFSQIGATYFRTRGGSTSAMTNASGADWDVNVAANYNFAYSEDGSSTLNFVNAGTLTKSGSALAYIGSAGVTTINNGGTITVSAGTLYFYLTTSILEGSGTIRLTADGITKPLATQTALTIGGTLEVLLAGGYDPANGTTIRLIDYGSSSGTFSTITPPQGRTVAETYESNGLDVTIN